MSFRQRLGAAVYRDRREGGAALAALLGRYAADPDAVVLGLVRGGVPVAAEAARRLALPLDVLVIRKLGVPWSPEVAFGAVGPGGVIVYNDDVARRLRDDQIEAVQERERTEVVRREQEYRAGKPPLDLSERVAVVVDDGLATGATARAAVLLARKLGAARVVVAVPVGSDEAVQALTELADEVVCPLVPPSFGAVGQYYGDFKQVADDQVRAMLHRSGAAARETDADRPAQSAERRRYR